MIHFKSVKSQGSFIDRPLGFVFMAESVILWSAFPYFVKKRLAKRKNKNR